MPAHLSLSTRRHCLRYATTLILARSIRTLSYNATQSVTAMTLSIPVTGLNSPLLSLWDVTGLDGVCTFWCNGWTEGAEPV
jgi:hypothetical protein